MNKISSVLFNDGSSPVSSLQIPTDERISAMLFDTTGFGDTIRDYSPLYENFSDNQVKLIDSMETAKNMGINEDGFMNGLIYYHLSLYFSRIGAPPVYVLISKCNNNWEAISSLQSQVGGRVFQVGIWTAQYLWKQEGDKLTFSSLLSKINSETSELSGVFNKQSPSSTPLSVVLCANTYGAENKNNAISYREIPSAKSLGYAKISVPLLQNGSEKVNSMQAKNPNTAPVSALGLIMGLLSTCGAEESIASHQTCNLNANELMTNPTLGVGNSNVNIEDISPAWLSNLSARGYIVPIADDLSKVYFLESDQTLITGDYGSISNNRVIHKCRRATVTALMPYVNRDFNIDTATGRLPDSESAVISSSVRTILDSTMRNSLGKRQIEDCRVIFNTEKAMDEDSIGITINITPVNYSHSIMENIASL